jgi:hypothetical protein
MAHAASAAQKPHCRAERRRNGLVGSIRALSGEEFLFIGMKNARSILGT